MLWVSVVSISVLLTGLQCKVAQVGPGGDEGEIDRRIAYLRVVRAIKTALSEEDW